MTQFSVIIPVYNAEKTLSRCLDSLLCQDLQNTEIILINDGSQDGSLAICRAYAELCDRIRYYSQENAGVSAARNAGLAHAQGDYILFVDSDDAVAPDYLRAISEQILRTNCDLLLFGAADNMGKTLFAPESAFLENGEEIAKTLSSYMKAGKLGSPCMKVFRNRIIQEHELCFPEQLAIAEDLTFVVRYCVHVETLAAISTQLYQVYVDNQESLSRKTRKDLYASLRDASLSILSAVEESALEVAEKRVYLDAASWLYYRSVYSAGKEAAKYAASPEERKKEIHKICDYFNSKRVRSYSAKGFLISLPIRLRASALIEWMTLKRLGR